MSTHSPRRVVVVHKQSIPLLSLFTTLVSVLLIVAGAVGLVLLQQPLQETQEVRSDASVENGPGLLYTNPGDNTSFLVNREAQIDLVVNTSGIQTSEISLVFSILTGTTDKVVIQTYADSGLEITQQEIEEIEGGLLIIFKAKPRTGTYSSTNSRIATLIFTPNRTGAFDLTFDAEKSAVYKANTSPREDILTRINPITYNIVSGDISVKSCNQSCGSNSECAPNHRCYDSRCRLATNPGNTSCVNPPDQGLQRQCNEYCADTRECASGFTCFYNKCRRPDNPDSESCALSNQSVQQAIAQSCNKSCQSNADCAVNMRCHQSQCRLASNVGSTSCSPATKKTVSPIYGGGTTVSPSPSPTATLRPNATSRPSTQSGAATGSGVLVPSPTPTLQPLPSVAPTIVPIPTPEPQNALGGFIDRFGITLPVVAMGIGFILLLVVIVLTILNQIRKRSNSGIPGARNNNSAPYESQLQAKIDALKTQPPSTQPPATLPPQPPRPMSPAPSQLNPELAKPAPYIEPLPANPPQSTLRPAGSAVVPKTTFTPPPATLQPTPMPQAEPLVPPVLASSGAPSSMLDRIKQKGLAVPGQSNTNQSNNSENTQG